MSGTILKVENLKKHFPIYGGVFQRTVGHVKAVDGVSFEVKQGETFALVGESGCGKSTTGRSILRLLEPTEGSIFFEDENLVYLNDEEMRMKRKDLQIIFQDPFASLNPRKTVLRILEEPLKIHGLFDDKQIKKKEIEKKEIEIKKIKREIKKKEIEERTIEEKTIEEKTIEEKTEKIKEISKEITEINKEIKSKKKKRREIKKERREKVYELLETVGLNRDQAKRYPHQFSGGQRQRIGIARALAVNPKLIIADEAVSALDVSIQSQVLNLLQDLQEKFGLTYIFISHDLSVVKHIANRIGVMYLGGIVETGSKNELFEEPLHPYTQALLSAIPVADPDAKKERIILTGDVPSPSNPPKGCKFHTRCSKKMDICEKEKPELRCVNGNHYVACHLYN